jgi:hypothetical protein
VSVGGISDRLAARSLVLPFSWGRVFGKVWYLPFHIPVDIEIEIECEVVIRP